MRPFLVHILMLIPVLLAGQPAEPDLAVPGGRLVNGGIGGQVYYFLDDSVGVHRDEEGRPRLLVQTYTIDGEAQVNLHALLRLGTGMDFSYLDSLLSSRLPGARYGGNFPHGLLSEGSVDCHLNYDDGQGVHRLAATTIRPGSREIALALHLDGEAAEQFHTALRNHPKQRLTIDFSVTVADQERPYYYDLTRGIMETLQTPER